VKQQPFNRALTQYVDLLEVRCASYFLISWYIWRDDKHPLASHGENFVESSPAVMPAASQEPNP
jgi:hypothetical protein